ncbi:MAG TPA: hypothetical protein VGT78_06615 [Rhizomicrobium sp.]|nr:hypothetical protein [Rhizomicrobium sp.]
MNKTTNMIRNNIRHQLLITVSAAALFAAAYGAGEAQAADNDSDRPLIWIELGGQWQRMSEAQEELSPPFMASITQANLLKALDVQKPAAYAVAGEGKISFQPDDSDWVFSASLQYGRSGAKRHHHQQTANKTVSEFFHFNPPYSAKYIGPKYFYPSREVKFADGKASQSENHLILDFQAGKDVGIGIFGGHGSSVVSAGVRVAHFTSKSDVTLRAQPDLQYPTAPITNKYERQAFYNAHIRFHNYAAMANAQRDFRGLGPTLSWNASVPVAGNAQATEITLDWGLNAAVLFGRQRASGHHQTVNKSYYFSSISRNGAYVFYRSGKRIRQVNFHNRYFGGENGTAVPTAQHTNSAPHDRSRMVTVPNLGGFAGISMHYQGAKVSFGYRADLFFGAIDGGIDARKSENRGFFGPFASISVGLP